jgi:hypothetical protein
MLREVLADMCVEVQGAIASIQNRLNMVSDGSAQGVSGTMQPALGPACEHCGAPLRHDRAGHAHAAPIHLRPAQAVGDGGVISSWEVGE